MPFEEAPGMGGLAGGDVLGSAGHYDFAAGVAAFGTEVDHVIRCLDYIEVVLDEEDGVSGVHQLVHDSSRRSTSAR